MKKIKIESLNKNQVAFVVDTIETLKAITKNNYSENNPYCKGLVKGYDDCLENITVAIQERETITNK